MLFINVVRVFELLESESSRTQKTMLLAEILRHATPEEAAIIAYLALGSIAATYTTIQFNIAEKSILKALAVLLGKKLTEMKALADQYGDLGLAAQYGQEGVVAEYEAHHPLLKEVYNFLHTLSLTTGEKSQERKELLFVEFGKLLEPVSLKFLIRIILGKLRLGFSDMTLLDAFSWSITGDKSLREVIEDAYNVCVDVGLVIKTLKEHGVDALKRMVARPGIPIKPAAAERLSDAQEIFLKLGPCVAQPKLDGFRLQVHVDKTGAMPEIHFYSRNLQDMSAMFPDLKAVVARLPLQNAIFEGEAISFDADTGLFLPFQETVKRKRKHDIETVSVDYPLRLFVFDLLYLNNQFLLAHSHVQRRNLILEVFRSVDEEDKKVVQPIEEAGIATARDLEYYFQHQISLGLEGVVVKRTDAPYRPGKRNFNWIKLKRQETGSLDDTIDCVILGYYFGNGKRAALGIGAFLVGIYNKERDCFQTVAKIGTGLTDAEWIDLKKECDAMKINIQPNNVECAKELCPDVWVQPTTVCMVRADEITYSPIHKACAESDKLGFALRFPRFMGYRPDKMASDATTTDELRQLFILQKNSKMKA